MGTIRKKQPMSASNPERAGFPNRNRLPAMVPWNPAAPTNGDLTQFVTVSPKYQIVIPQAIREALQIKPGDRLCLMLDGGDLRILLEAEGLGFGSVPEGADFVRDEEDRV